MTMEVDGARLTEGEIAPNCYVLLLGANVNTGQVISAAMLALVDDTEQYEPWATTPKYMKPGMAEALRRSSPVARFLHYAVADAEIRRQRVRRADAVVAWIASVNRDEDVFEDPYRFDIARGETGNRVRLRSPPVHRRGRRAHQPRTGAAGDVRARGPLRTAGEVEHLCSNFTGGIKHLSPTRRVMSATRGAA